MSDNRSRLVHIVHNYITSFQVLYYYYYALQEEVETHAQTDPGQVLNAVDYDASRAAEDHDQDPLSLSEFDDNGMENYEHDHEELNDLSVNEDMGMKYTNKTTYIMYIPNTFINSSAHIKIIKVSNSIRFRYKSQERDSNRFKSCSSNQTRATQDHPKIGFRNEEHHEIQDR